MINNIPLVSVLMTAYNREKYIAEAIESVLNSSYSNFELIVVDDCSTDRSVEIAKRYESFDKRVKVFVNAVNVGDYPNRNIAAKYAKGKYLKYLDSDDLMRANCLETMVYQMELHPECAFGISSRSLTSSMVHGTESSYRVHFFERGILDMGPSASIIRKDIFIKEGGFWHVRCVSDFEFWLRLANKYSVLEFERDLIFWRQHDFQEYKLGKLEYVEHMLKIISNKLIDSKLEESDKNLILKYYRKNISRYLIKSFFSIGIINSIKLWRGNKLCILDVI